jgi:hypothetical protein
MSSLNALFLEDNFRFHAFDRSHQVVLVLFALSIVALVLLRRASLAAKRAVLVGIALTVYAVTTAHCCNTMP